MDGLHFLADNSTSVRCHTCSSRLNIQRRSKMVCPACPNRYGFCSANCFNLYHQETLGYELRPAAFKSQGKSQRKKGNSKDRSVHYLVFKPPTETNERPRGKCHLFRLFKKDKHTRLQCNFCEDPFCSNEHMMEHHLQLGILDESDNSSDEHTSSKTTSTQTTERGTSRT